MIEIDENRCTGCGLCAADCFPGNIQLKNGKAKALDTCMNCGHCYAICPVGAVRVEGYPEDGVIDTTAANPADAAALLERIKVRRSIRTFKDQPIARGVLEQVLEAGRFTPTGGNRQDVHYTVIQRELEAFKKSFWQAFEPALGKLAETAPSKAPMIERLRLIYQQYAADNRRDGLFFNAPVLLVLDSPSPLNGGLSAASIELMANASGLGALYSGYIQAVLGMQPLLCEQMGIDANGIRACLLLGYPDVTYPRSAPRLPVHVDWR